MSEERLREAYALHQAGRLTDAAQIYGHILANDPKNFHALLLFGLLHLQTGRFQEAERILGEAVGLDPNSFDALSARSTALLRSGRHGEAFALLDRLIVLRPEHALTWNNRGNMLLEMGRIEEAMQSYDRAVAIDANYAEAWHNRAVARIMVADYSGAEADLDRALLLKPDYADALDHHGVALTQQGRHQEALSSYDAALKLQPANVALLCRRADSLLCLDRLQEALSSYDHVLTLSQSEADVWHNRGVVLLRLGHIEDALASYHRALAIAPDHAEALKSRGHLLSRLQRDAEAVSDFDRVLSSRRDDAAAWQGRGNALARLNHEKDALESFDEALRLQPGDAAVLFNRASVLLRLARYEEARRDVEALLAIDPDYPFARGLLMHARLHVCDWHGLDEARREIAAALSAGQRVLHPFGHLAFSDSLAEQLQCARITVREFYPPSSTTLWRGERYSHDKIRIAYLSGDYYSHAVAFLIAGVFEHHDRSRFETFGISFSPNDNGAMRARLEKGFTRFIDVWNMRDDAVAAMLRELEIDIAVDLKGYTGGARPGILAHRPAPIQVHYLGYPGTMGAAYIDYLIADRIVVPEEHRAFYSEQIVYLPDTYQCNDSLRRIADRTFTRASAGLPENAFVFCCFNGSQKIMPEMFHAWMNILSKVEGSVLWLMEEHPLAAANLRREAQAKGVAAERLIFAKRMPLEDHLARLKLADLVLDTLPYGAHTTASDALWVGVPVLTRIGKSFTGRVAASLLHAVGVPELVAHSLEEYEAQACRLAQNTSIFAAIKTNLAKNRETMPLFDTARITRHLEAAYVEMRRRHQNGEGPASFAAG